ncbi:MAG TPA: cell wall-active antibiotics response protein LiaF [Bacteroidota bacterium]|nr:cell wall-active antibiotics response protein LiaF [Bacteroidota bacterium]
MRNLFWGTLFILFGVFLLLDNLGYADLSEILHNYWPVLLILWGGFMLLRRRGNTAAPPAPDASSPPPASAPPPPDQQFPPPPTSSGTYTGPALMGELIHQSQIFGDITSRITSQNFKGGSISSIFGDSHIDLSGAVFADGTHELKVHSVFGNSTILLPKDAAISVSATSVFGDLNVFGERKSGFSSEIRTSTEAYASQSRRLHISLTKVFGDTRIG